MHLPTAKQQLAIAPYLLFSLGDFITRCYFWYIALRVFLHLHLSLLLYICAVTIYRKECYILLKIKLTDLQLFLKKSLNNRAI